MNLTIPEKLRQSTTGPDRQALGDTLASTYKELGLRDTARIQAHLSRMSSHGQLLLLALSITVIRSEHGMPPPGRQKDFVQARHGSTPSRAVLNKVVQEIVGGISVFHGGRFWLESDAAAARDELCSSGLVASITMPQMEAMLEVSSGCLKALYPAWKLYQALRLSADDLARETAQASWGVHLETAWIS